MAAMALRALRTALLTGAALALAGPALAQGGGRELEEVIVTATKRDEALSEVPISVSVISGARLAETGTSSFAELDDYVPNLEISATPAVPIIVMRGIGSSNASLAFEQSVSMFVDGVYVGRAKQFAVPLFDIDHIEVLRGPQAALGKNTSAGAIVAVSARPTAEPMMLLDASHEFELRRTELSGVVSGPLSDRLRARVAVRWEDQQEGHLRNTKTGTDDPRPSSFVGRVLLDWRGEGFEAVGKVEVARRRVGGQPFQTVSLARGIRFDGVREAGSVAGPEFDEVRSENASLRADWTLGGHVLTSISGWSAYRGFTGLDADFFGADISYSDFDDDYEQWSQELRLVSPEHERFEYIVGVYGQKSDLYVTRLTHLLTALPGSNRRYFNQDTTVLSAFGEATLKLTPTLRAKAGLRFTRDDKDARYRQISGAGAIGGNAPTSAAFTDKRSESLLDPSATLQWDASPDAMLFASYVRGSKGGGFQGDIAGATLSNFQFRPERSESFEAGARLHLFDRAAYVNATAFLTRYSDLQVTTLDPASTVLSFITRNAGGAESRGVEVEAAWNVAEGLNLQLSLAYLDAEFTDFTAGQCALGQASNGSSPGTCTYNGVRLPYSSRWNGAASIDWLRPLTDRVVLMANAGVRFSDDTRYTAINDPRAVQPSVAKIDLRAGVAAPDRGWEVALLVRNLTDERTFSFATTTVQANAAGVTSPDGRAYAADLPRTIAIQARVRY